MERLMHVRVGALVALMTFAAMGWSGMGSAGEFGRASISTESGRTTSSHTESFMLHDELYQIEWDLESLGVSTTSNLHSWSQGVAVALEACRWFARSASVASQPGFEPGEVSGHTVVLDDFLGAFDFQLDNTGGRWFSLFSVDAGRIEFRDGVGSDCRLVSPHVDVRRSGTGPYDYTAVIATEFTSSESLEHGRSGGDVEGLQAGESVTANGIDIRGDAKLRVQEAGCRPWVTQVNLHDVSFWSGATHIRLNGSVELDMEGILSGSINVSLNVERSFVEFVENSGIFDDPVTARIAATVMESGSGDYEIRCSEGRCRVYGTIVPFLPIGKAPQFPRTC